MKKMWWRSGLVLVALGSTALAACGDDDGDASSESPPPGEAAGGANAAFCDAALAFENAPEPEIDFESASPDELSAATTAYANETLLPLAQDLAATAPDEVSEAANATVEVVEEIASTGDFAPFEDPDFNALADEAEAFTQEECGWRTLDVRLVDYRFEGLPDELAPGVVNFELTNEGQELHEMILFRKNDGVTASAAELLELSEEEAEEMVTFVTQAIVDPGDTTTAVADLEPGDYVAVCFIPVGLTSEDAEPAADAPPHHTEGMVQELTVR